MAKFEAGQIVGSVGWGNTHADRFTGCVAEDSDVILLARLELNDETTDLIDDVESIDWAAYDVNGSGTATASGTLVASSVISNTLLTGATWDVDSIGYNFTHAIAETVFTIPGRYRIEHKFTWAAGGNVSYMMPVFEIQVQGFKGS